MDCKKVLVETDGNIEKAIELLRERGIAKAAKKAGRIAAEGLVESYIHNGKYGALVEVNSETDFVAKNEIFQEFVQSVADTALASGKNGGKNGEDVEALLDAGLRDVIADKTLKIGEKLSFRRFEKVEGDAVVSYLHGGGKIGVLVAANGASDDAAKEALSNIAMQIAAMNPQYIARNEISDEELAKIREITIDSALNDPASLPKPIQNELYAKVEADKLISDADLAILAEKKNDKYLYNFLSKEAIAKLGELALAGKADYVANKIFSGLVEGRISKQLKDIVLMDQTYVKAEDGKQTVGKYLESVNKALTVAKFVRFEVGEGMEKKNEDFAAEVAAQLG